MTATGQKDGTTTAAASGDLTTGDPGAEMGLPWVTAHKFPAGVGHTDILDAKGSLIARVYRTGAGHTPHQRARLQMILASADTLAALHEARLQLEYLADKFVPTSTGVAVLARVERAIDKAEGRT